MWRVKWLIISTFMLGRNGNSDGRPDSSLKKKVFIASDVRNKLHALSNDNFSFYLFI